jgi:hypothetical protein
MSQSMALEGTSPSSSEAEAHICDSSRGHLCREFSFGSGATTGSLKSDRLLPGIELPTTCLSCLPQSMPMPSEPFVSGSLGKRWGRRHSRWVDPTRQPCTSTTGPPISWQIAHSMRRSSGGLGVSCHLDNFPFLYIPMKI